MIFYGYFVISQFIYDYFQMLRDNAHLMYVYAVYTYHSYAYNVNEFLV